MYFRKLACFFLIFLTCPLYGMDNMYKTWATYFYAGGFEFNPKIKKEFEANFRFSDLNRQELNAVQLRGGLGYEVRPAVNVLAGYERDLFNAFISPETRTTYENIIWQQVSWAASTEVNFRARVEEREHPGAVGWGVRLRQKIAYTPLNNYLFGPFLPVVSDELFFLVNHPDWVSSSTFEQNRLFIGIQAHNDIGLWWQIGYMNQYIAQNHGAPPAMNHIAYLALNYVPH